MHDSDDDRSALVQAIQWSSRLTGVGLEMALPGVGGYWLDRWLGTAPVLLIVGTALGFAVGILQMVQWSKSEDSGHK